MDREVLLAEKVVHLLQSARMNLTTENTLKKDMLSIFNTCFGAIFAPEYSLSKEDRPDFFGDGVAVEVKIKGRAVAIYKQCERYCQHDEVKCLVLVTNKSMGFPKEINGKPCYVARVGMGRL